LKTINYPCGCNVAYRPARIPLLVQDIKLEEEVERRATVAKRKVQEYRPIQKSCSGEILVEIMQIYIRQGFDKFSLANIE